jgi:hypothetical protein
VLRSLCASSGTQHSLVWRDMRHSIGYVPKWRRYLTECGHRRLEQPGHNPLHPLDRDFAMLHTKLETVDADSSERRLIECMVHDCAMPHLDGFSLRVKQVFEVDREGDAAKYAPFRRLGNKQLLWSGAPELSYRSILREGLTVTSPLCPSLGRSSGIVSTHLHPAPPRAATMAIILLSVPLRVRVHRGVG